MLKNISPSFIYGRLREVPHAVWQRAGVLEGCWNTEPGEHRGAGRVLTQGEKGQGEAFTHDRWIPQEDQGKKSKLSPALDIWNQAIYVASQSQMITMGIKGALMEVWVSSSDIFCVLCLGFHTDVQKEYLKISHHHSTIIYVHINTDHNMVSV